MKCDKCGSPNVVTKIVIQGEKNADELNLCPNCFQTFVKDHPEIKQGPMGKSLNEFLLGTLNLLNSGFRLNNENNESHNIPIKQCPNCSTTSVKIQKEGIAGCAGCYTFFKNDIEDYISKYIGVNPKSLEPDKRSKKQILEELKTRLVTAVKTENYEIAAAIRDEIKKLGKI